MKNELTITIDGKPCTCEQGEYLLDIAARNGIDIPALCHHEGLPGQGCCRVCVVETEINNWRSVVTACVYPVERECAVFTASENVSRQRKMVLSLLRALAPESKEITQLCEKYSAIKYERFVEKAENKCILCGLCAKACENLGTGAISTVHRGIDKTVSTPYEEPSLVCVGCASCAMVCPTQAVEVEETEKERTIWGKAFTLVACESCGIPIGTLSELERAAGKTEKTSALCDLCKKKAITDAMVAVYGK